jgi:hypothetical protein
MGNSHKKLYQSLMPEIITAIKKAMVGIEFHQISLIPAKKWGSKILAFQIAYKKIGNAINDRTHKDRINLLRYKLDCILFPYNLH